MQAVRLRRHAWRSEEGLADGAGWSRSAGSSQKAEAPLRKNASATTALIPSDAESISVPDDLAYNDRFRI